MSGKVIDIPTLLKVAAASIPSECLLDDVKEVDTIIVSTVVTRKEVLENPVISNAVANGRFFLTINHTENGNNLDVTISVSPLVLRSSILRMAQLLPELKELLVTSGFESFDVASFGLENYKSGQRGKKYEQFHMLIEKFAAERCRSYILLSL